MKEYSHDTSKTSSPIYHTLIIYCFVVDVIFTTLPTVPNEKEAASAYIEELTLLSSN